MKFTAAQETIYNHLANGAKLQCTEGANYKTWIEYPHGKQINIRRDVAERFCEKFNHCLEYNNNGIKLKKRYRWV